MFIVEVSVGDTTHGRYAHAYKVGALGGHLAQYMTVARAPATFTLDCEVDAANRVAESDEGNNTYRWVCCTIR